jgi:WD40 repeat protein
MKRHRYKTGWIMKMAIGIGLLAVLLGSAIAAEKPEIFVQLGHTHDINAFQFSSDVKYLVTGSDDLTVKLWDVASGMEVRTFRGHQTRIKAVAVSADGRQVLSGDDKGGIKLWDAMTGREVRSMTVLGFVTHLSFSPDGRFFTSVDLSSGMMIWEVATGQSVKRFDGLRSYPDSGETMIVVQSGAQRHPSVLALSSGKEIGTFTWEKFLLIGKKAFSQDGRYGLFTNNDYQTKRQTIETVDIQSDSRIASWDLDDEKFNHFALSPDGHYVLAAGRAGMKLWNFASGRELRTFTTSYTSKAIFSPDGKFIVSAGAYAPALWNVADGRVVNSFMTRPLPLRPYSVVSPDGRYILTNSDNMPPFIVDASTGKIIKIFNGYKAASSFLTDGRHLLLVGNNDQRVLWNMTTDKLAKTYPGLAVGRSKDGRYAAGILTKRDVKVWDADADKEILIYTEHAGDISRIYFSGDNRQLLVVVGNVIKLVDIASGREALSLQVPSGSSLWQCDTSADGRQVIVLALSTGNGVHFRLTIWDSKTGREIKSYPASNRFALSPDGRSVLFSRDGSSATREMALCEIATGRILTTFKGHRELIDVMNFSQDGETIVSSGADKLIKLWDAATGKEKMTFAGHDSGLYSAAITPDGKGVISSASDGTTRLWEATTGRQVATYLAFTDGEWMVTTPEGYFNASQKAAKYLNVTIGNQVYSIDNFYEKFFNPVYVASVLQGKQVDAVADIRQGILSPPDVRITSPVPGSVFSADTLTVVVAAKDTGGGVDELRLYHNGKVIGDDKRSVKIIPRGKETIREYNVQLVDGVNTFRAVGYSKDRTESNPYELLVKLTAPSKDVSLYVLAVGINKYKNPALNLNYAEPDARGIAGFFSQQGGGLFKKVHIVELYNEQAIRENIVFKLNQMQKTNPQDAVLIYLAGHGESLNDKWYFIPHELTYPEREEDVKAKGISSDDLSGSIKSIKAQKILLLVDACKSGAVLIAFRGFEDRKALSQLSRSTGVHIVAASTKDQFAAEVKDLGHGVFTHTLLEGLNGKAAGKGESVTVRKLMGYVEEQLPQITKKYKQEAQYPVVDSRGMDFPLVMGK